jgi:uncharacterized protein
MENIKVVIDNKGVGEVQLFDNDIKAGKMDISITNEKLTVYHTEVAPEFEGRGFAKVLLSQLVSYAKANELKIIPLCPYVNLQFRRHPAEYENVWSKENNQ